jgi:selenocysteine lyase/cysteine desulfurase
MVTSPSYDIDAIRRRIPSLERWIPMNNCSQAPQMDLTREAADAYLDSWRRDGMDWDRWVGEVEAARASFARLIKADPCDVAICTSVSQATSSVASALDYSRGRRKVVVTEGEFPTVGQVWMAQERRGAQVAWVPARDGVIPLEGYHTALDDETLLVSACHGYYQSGFKQDIASVVGMAREAGALVYVDAYQTLGTGPLDVKILDVDFLASGALKFLMAVPGIAFLYVKPSVAATLEPAVTGWFGRANPFSFDPRDQSWAQGARRFDTGTPPVLEAYVARAAMDFLQGVGLEAIGSWTRELSAALVTGGRDRGLSLLGTPDPDRKAPTTAFLVPGDSHEVERKMRERGVIASARGAAIRLAPHFYSTRNDVEVALDALEDVLKGTA